MKMKNQKGFTLIELLVVIAIIGLLSTIAVVAMQGARAKARDAKRISDVKQMSTVLDVENASNEAGVALAGCTGAANTKTNLCSNVGDINNTFGTASANRMCDPGNATPCGGTACATGGALNCDYSISQAGGGTVPRTNDYRICFFLESTNQFGALGLYRITSGGTVTAGCP